MEIQALILSPDCRSIAIW